MAKFIETQGRKVVARGWGKGEMGSCLMGIEFQMCKTKTLETGWLHNVKIRNTTELHSTLKYG